MLVPHLLFAHLLADYPLQTDWLVVRKGNIKSGLLLHGGIVGFMSLLAVAPYLGEVWLAVLVLTVLHTLQDFLKVQLGPRLKTHPVVPYFGDQILHYITIVGLQLLLIGNNLSPEPTSTEAAFMWTGAAVITVTRYYEVTWWANWLDMIPYMKRWRITGYLERISMLALAAAGLWFVAPLAVFPRLVISYRQDKPIWKQRRGALELGLGIVVSIVLGIGLHIVYTGI
ncbi:MAG: DUF3307 domain-containing protein [Chloroflexi bacterium]|nr:DUF3307 domain-containing protein [Chloroflexota bacterium]